MTASTPTPVAPMPERERAARPPTGAHLARQSTGAAPVTDQAAFTAALLDPDLPCPADLRSWNGSDPAPRFAVHRNNVIVSLVDAVADQFPVTLELVGTEFFRAMARVFVQQHPPRSRIIAAIGVPFADFIASFAPAATVPYLADVARLELARIEACHAADADTLGADAIGRAMADPQRLAQLSVELHPSVRLLSSPHAVFSLWAAHQGAFDIAEVDPDIAQQVLVFRDGLDVQAMQITPGACCFLTQLGRGASLAEAVEAADAAAAAEPGADASAPFDLPGTLALLLRHPLATRMEPRT